MPETYFAGWVIDGSGKQPRKNVCITVRGGEIHRLDADRVDTGTTAGAVDLSNCTVLPGLLDSHVHLFMSGTPDTAVREKQLDADFESVRDNIDRRLKQCLKNGVVAVRDGGDRHAHTLTYCRTLLHRKDLPVRVFAAGKAWRQKGRYGKLIGRPPEKGRSLAQALSDTRETADHVKIVNSGLNSLIRFGKETPPQFSLEEMTAAVAEAKRLGLKTMVHANGRIPVDIAVRSGCDSIEHGFFMGRENLEQMAEHRTVWVPTVYTMQAYWEVMKNSGKQLILGTVNRARNPKGGIDPVDGARRNLDHQMEQIRQARKLGVRIGVGTDAGSTGVYHGKSLRKEIGLLLEGGYSVQDAIGSATSVNAKLMGIEDRLLAAGMPATFVAVKGPPEDIPDSLAKIVSVVVDGIQWVE